jgi:hypothetical protein
MDCGNPIGGIFARRSLRLELKLEARWMGGRFLAMQIRQHHDFRAKIAEFVGGI